jgi:hypothetical protein
LAQYGGELEIQTRPQAGFSLRLTLPTSAPMVVASEGVTA